MTKWADLVYEIPTVKEPCFGTLQLTGGREVWGLPPPPLFVVQEELWHSCLDLSSWACGKNTACSDAACRENSWSFGPAAADLALAQRVTWMTARKKMWIKWLHYWGAQNRAILLWLWSRNGCGNTLHQRQGWRLNIFPWEGWGLSMLFCRN